MLGHRRLGISVEQVQPCDTCTYLIEYSYYLISVDVRDWPAEILTSVDSHASLVTSFTVELKPG